VSNSPIARDYVERTAITTAGQMTINQKMLANIPIPILSLHEQHQIIERFGILQAKTDALKCLQNETAAELDALMPSILDKAFMGEL
jgi:type I restriction enzyme S subunit